MGNERRVDKVKEMPVAERPAGSKQASDEEIDTSHAERQLEMRGRGTPVGFDDEPIDHMFKGVGDQEEASIEMERILDAGVPVTGLVERVQNLNALRREEVFKRMRDVAKVASGNEVLQIADLVGVPVAEKIRAALAAKVAPSPSALRAHLAEISLEDRVAILDEPTLAALAAKYPMPADVVPGIATLDLPVLKNQALVAWYLRTTPPRQVARGLMRSGRPVEDLTELATIFNAIGREGWTWALEVDAALAVFGWYGPAHWAKLTNQPDIAAHLEAHASKGVPGSRKGKAPGDAKALQALVPEGGVDVDAVVAALEDARMYQKHEGKALAKSPYRERLIAAATLEQLETILRTISSDVIDDFAWYIESPHATPSALREIVTLWDQGWLADIAERPGLIAKVMARFPTAGPADIFPAQARALYPMAYKNATIRKWCTINADPRDLLALVTQNVSSIATLWTGILDDGVRPDWYKGLGTGVGAKNDKNLRKLVLNIPDAEAAAWIRHTMIGDLIEDKISNDAEPVDAIAYESDARKRFEHGLGDHAARDIGHRTSELSDAEVAKLRDNPDELAAILPRMTGAWLTRNLLRIEPPLPIVLRHANLGEDTLPAYIRTRPATETAEAFAEDAIEHRLTRELTAPFVVLPALREPTVLAASLTRVSTLTWLLKHADVVYVMSLLAHPAVAKTTTKVFAEEHLALVPIFFARKEDREAVKRFALALPADLEEQLLEHTEDPAAYDEDEDEDEDGVAEPEPPPKAPRGSFEPHDVQARQEELESALALGDLAKALDVVLKRPISVQNVLAVCRHHAHDAAKLFGKPEHGERVAALRQALGLSPLAVFPDLPYYAYFHTPESRAWLFHHEPPMAILREIALDPQFMRIVIEKLDAEDPGIESWLSNMPKGTALTAGERRLVQRLFKETTKARAARTLFEIRFGSRAGDTYTREELAKLWDLLELVPDAHIEMGSVKSFTEAKTHGPSGVFSPGNQNILLEEGLITDNRTNTMFDQTLELTREQLIAAYGYDDQQLKARVAAGEIHEVQTAKGTRYVIQPVSGKLLDLTVLHEIGHAVDNMLGERTELVYGLAGWREFGESDIDTFATDLGGWDRVTPADQALIKDAWAVWLNSRAISGLNAFVPESHPALADKYKSVGIVELARKKRMPGLDLGPQNGRLTIVNSKNQRFYRVPERTRDAAPSWYSMTAPAEYFAECYAEYYREYAGPGTESKKGGRLASWIKTWFDQNIDNLKYNPSRTDRP